MIFLHPTDFDNLVKDGIQIITEEDYLSLKKAIQEGLFGDIEKAKRDGGFLVPVKRPIVRNGKIIMETYYINPNKTKVEDKPKIVDRVNHELHKHLLERESKPIEGYGIYEKGDLVKLKMQDGSDAIGQFRSFKKYGDKDLAVIRVSYTNRNGKQVTDTITREVNRISPVNPREGAEIKKVERVKDPNVYRIGDTVDFGTKDGKRQGVVVKKNGDELILSDNNGNMFSRYPLAVVKIAESESSLTEEQVLLLNKAIRGINRAVQDKIDMQHIYTKRQSKGWEDNVQRLNDDIENDRNLQYNYLQVFKGKIPFEDVLHEEERKIRDIY